MDNFQLWKTFDLHFWPKQMGKPSKEHKNLKKKTRSCCCLNNKKTLRTFFFYFVRNVRYWIFSSEKDTCYKFAFFSFTVVSAVSFLFRWKRESWRVKQIRSRSQKKKKKKKRRPYLSLNRKKLDDRLNIKDERKKKNLGDRHLFFFLFNNHHQKLVDDKTTATRLTTI